MKGSLVLTTRRQSSAVTERNQEFATRCKYLPFLPASQQNPAGLLRRFRQLFLGLQPKTVIQT